ncbi:MAG TPA: DUF2851 family protein [Saprospiraceae bacterium]|nr:DUF2851 family protein [Saprospiraceae bacterium]
MKEDLLQYFWRTHNWKDRLYVTTNGLPIHIVTPGILNHDAGPDFSNAKIRIGDELWVGNVEIHVRSSEWYIHRHQYDPAYRTVILHVVWTEDQPVFMDENIRIPCLALKSIISKEILDNYERLMNNALWVPCQNVVNRFDMEKGLLGMNARLVEKFEDKSAVLQHIFDKTKGDWNETLHRFIARGFGLNVNGDAFELLAEKMNYQLTQKYQHDPVKLEAIAFSASGLIPDGNSDHTEKLWQIYQTLPHNDRPTPLAQGVFKFFRTRPSNFPGLRIAQWLKFLSNPGSLFDTVINLNSPIEFSAIICQPLDEFWKNHFSFTAEAKNFSTQAGKDFADLLLINSIAPFLFFYGKITDNYELRQKAVDLLDAMKAESNSVIRGFRQLGFPINFASHSQAFLLLKKKYCDRKRCLECPFGVQIFK